MSLLLRLDNVDKLPDGGPVSYEVNRRGLDIGRDPYLDWTLPDPERFISGKHCEVRYRDGCYWLHDVSTNGTTLNGRPGRVTEPYRLQNGDRIHIGHYIIAVELTEEDDTGPVETEPAVTKDPFSTDPWGGIDNVADAVNRRDFVVQGRSAPGQDARRGPVDLAEENISWSVGQITEGAVASDAEIWGAPASEGAGASSNDWGWAPAAPTVEKPAAADFRAPESQPHSAVEAETSAAEPMTEPGATEPEVSAPPADPFSPLAAEPASDPAHTAEPFVSAVDPLPTGALEAAPADMPAARQEAPSPALATGLAGRWAGGSDAADAQPAPTSHAPETRGTAAEISASEVPAGQPAVQAGGFVAAFERGAGMPAGSVAARGEEAFAEELGALMRLVTENLQAMLAARAETKSAMRSSERTMIGALENNPLKFSPTPEDALRIMFGAKGRSYLDAPKTIESSFHDLQKHQLQTFAAMQQALQALIEDLDPQSIEDATAKDGGLAGIVGSRRARFWDTYVERFRAKAGRHERGMIDTFMILFSEMYDRQR